MNKNVSKWIVILLIASTIAIACAPATAAPSATQVITATVAPSATIMPSATPRPTSTPVPASTPIPEVTTKLKAFDGELVTLQSCQKREDANGFPLWIYEVVTDRGRELAKTDEAVDFAIAVSTASGITGYEVRYEFDLCRIPMKGKLAYSLYGFEPTLLEIYTPTDKDKEVDAWFAKFEPAYRNMAYIGEWKVGADYFSLWGHSTKCGSMLELAWITDWTREEFDQLAKLCLAEVPSPDRALEWLTGMNEMYNYVGTESDYVIDDSLITLTFAKKPLGSRLQGVLSPDSKPVQVREDITATVSSGEGAPERLFLWPWESYDWLKVSLSHNPFDAQVMNGGFVAFLTLPEYKQFMRPCCYDSPSVSDIPRGLKVWQVKANP